MKSWWMSIAWVALAWTAYANGFELAEIPEDSTLIKIQISSEVSASGKVTQLAEPMSPESCQAYALTRGFGGSMLVTEVQKLTPSQVAFYQQSMSRDIVERVANLCYGIRQ